MENLEDRSAEDVTESLEDGVDDDFGLVFFIRRE